MKRTGRIVVVAVYKEPVAVDLITLGYGEIEILGSCVYTPADFAKSVGLVVSLVRPPTVSHLEQWYEEAGPVDDAEVMDVLARPRGVPGGELTAV